MFGLHTVSPSPCPPSREGRGNPFFLDEGTRFDEGFPPPCGEGQGGGGCQAITQISIRRRRLRIRRITTSAVLIGALALGLAACEKQDTAATGTDAGATVVRIGSVAPLTGPQATLGRDNDNGARLALDEINAAGVTLGGRKVKFV